MAGDAVDVDEARVVYRGQTFAETEERLAQQPVLAAPEHARSHLTSGRPNVVVEELLVFEIDACRQDKIFAVEERADGDLDSGGELLDLEAFNLRTPAPLEKRKHRDDVFSVLFLADIREHLFVLSL